MAAHTVQPGECLLSIAAQHGYFWKTLWDHPDNQKLREARKSAALLAPGDVIQIPDKTPKQKVAALGQKHSFQIKQNRALLALRLVQGGEPLAGEPYALTVAGQTLKGKTDGDGKLEQPIPAVAAKAVLVLEKRRQRYDLQLGHLDPPGEVAGAQARLANLGFYEGSIDGEAGPRTREALAVFQTAAGLDPTGELDDATRDELESRFGC